MTYHLKQLYQLELLGKISTPKLIKVYQLIVTVSLMDLPRSTALVHDWNALKMETLDMFAEVEHSLVNDGIVKFIVRHNERERLYQASQLNGYVEADGNIAIRNGYYPSTFTDTSVDLFVQFPLSAFGKEHELTLGMDYRSSDHIR